MAVVVAALPPPGVQAERGEGVTSVPAPGVAVRVVVVFPDEHTVPFEEVTVGLDPVIPVNTEICEAVGNEAQPIRAG